MKYALRASIWRMALPAVELVAVATAPAPAAQQAPVVKVTKMPVTVQHRTFDPRRPPQDMPELTPPENAVCASDFLLNASVGGEAVQTDATHATLTVNRVEVTLQLNITIWVPHNPPKTVVEHEEGHRQIAEHFYKHADAVAKRVAEPYLGKKVDISGRDLRKAMSVALGKFSEDITEAYNKHMPVGATEARYDAITEHSLNDIPVPDAIAQAIRGTASVPTQPTATAEQVPPSPPQQAPLQPQAAPAQPAPAAASAEFASQNDSPQAASAGESGTPAATAKIAATAGKYDILGIKLGMPIQEALGVLKTYNPNFKIEPDSIKYDVLPSALTYGVNAVSPKFNGGRGVAVDAEKLYFLVAMPPNQPVVSKISRIITFGKETIPTGDTVVADLIKKYGPPSWDSGPDSLNGLGARDLFWANDQQGNRLPMERDALYQCAALSTFTMSQADTDRALNSYNSINIQMNPNVAKYRVELGFGAHADNYPAGLCGHYTMIRARLFDTRSIRISTPGLVAGLMVMVASAPLDRSATDATHHFLMQAIKAREAKEKAGAQKNRPSL